MNRVIVSLLLIVGVPAYIEASRTPTSLPLEARDYTVKRGDTLSTIARKFHIPLQRLLRANRLKSNSSIRPGQKIIIPALTSRSLTKKSTKHNKASVAKSSKAKAKKKRELSYTVRAGDTLSIIARKYGLTGKELKIANGLKSGALIHIGQVLKIPQKAKKDSNSPQKSHAKKEKSKAVTASYIVQAGDTIVSIAKRHGLSEGELRAVNRLKKGAILHVGQTLKIPSTKAKNDSSSKKKRKAHTVEYIVQSGDTILSIAKRHNLSEGELRAANRLKKGAILHIGQTLKIPPSKAKSVASSQKDKKKTKNRLYTVQEGDTLFSIARKYHTPLKDLVSINGFSPTELIHPGQEIKIPGVTYHVKETEKKKEVAKKESKKRKAVTYTVKKGDTLWKIAKKYKISISKLRKLNHLGKKTRLHLGMKLIIKPAPVYKRVPIYYTIRKGDTLWKVAKKYKISLAKLRKLNHLKKGTPLRKGMKLAVGSKEVLVLDRKEAQRLAAKKRAKKTRLAKRRSRRYRGDRRINSALAALSGRRRGRGDYNVIRIAKRYLGRRYVWGAEGPSSFDCSGFTQYVMRKSKGVRIPRVSRQQAYYGKYVSRRNLKPGDLIFFDTSRRRRGYVNHVGIYIGNNKFIHASSARHRVVITSLNRPFYRSRFKWGRRIN